MPRGAPDYWGISYRPSFGAAKAVNFTAPVVASVAQQIISVSGNGIIYGGLLTSQGIATQQNDTFAVIIDGSSFVQHTFVQLNVFNADKEHCAPVYLLKFDNVAFVYTFGLMPGITYEDSFSIFYLETHGQTPTVRAHVIYTEI